MVVVAHTAKTAICDFLRLRKSVRCRSRFLPQHRKPTHSIAPFWHRQLRPAALTRAVSEEALNRALCDGSDWEQPAEGFNSIPEALADLAEGKFVVVLDDERRENEGDLVMAAEKMTTEAMAFMVEYTSGVICVPLEGR